MPNTVREAIETMIFYSEPVYGRPVRLRAYETEWWKGFEEAIQRGYIEENTDIDQPYRREFRLLRKGYEYAKSIGLIVPGD